MARKKKKHGEEEHENMERWLVSYADFITLLFAFFVTMYSVSRVDEKKMGSAVESMQRALGSVMPIQMTYKEPGVFSNQVLPLHLSITPIEGKAYTADGRALVKMAEDIKKGIEDISKGKTSKASSNLAHQIKFILEKRGLVIRVSDHIFFNSGEAYIRSDMEPILNVLGQTLEIIPNQIRVEGHTDNVPIHTARFPSNWELSTARATTIVRYLLDGFRFDPDRLSATGYAEYRPVDTNNTSEGRLQNRRVDFVILSNKEMESEPQKEASTEQKNPI